MFTCEICGKQFIKKGNHPLTHINTGFVPWNKGGGNYRPESLIKMSLSQKARFQVMPNPFAGRKHTEEAKQKQRSANLGKFRMNEGVNEQRKRKLSIAKKGKPRPPHIQKILADWRERLANDPELRQEIEKKAMQAARVKPTSIEKHFMELCHRFTLPYRYVGNGEIWIGKMNPDFINTNGKKQVVELLGRYWHTEEEINVRIKKYATYGFECIPIWEEELKDKFLILSKLGVK